jgi:hypothetical protein
MTHDQTAGDCPFLQPWRPLSARDRQIGIYCRLPGGRVRVPPLEDVRRYCEPGRWQACPVQARHAPPR